MKVMISIELNDIYKMQHKNYDYAITSILDNFDPESYTKCFDLLRSFELKGEKCDISIGDEVAERIVADFEMDILDNMTAELLLWLGVIFPEV